MALTESKAAPARDSTRGPAVPRRGAAVVAQREDDRSHFLEAQEESGRQMRAFIEEHYGDAE